jgi:hypothetical protein
MKKAIILLFILAVVILSGCGQSEESAPPALGTPAAISSASTPSGPTTTSTTTAVYVTTSTGEPETNSITRQDIDEARQVVLDYWQAFNNYDMKGALAYLEDSYRQERAEGLTSDNDRMKAYYTKLGVEEEAEPSITPDGKIEIKIRLKTPIGARHVTYRLMEVSGGWKICYSSEE